jgi:serine/threonine-protein kinase
MSEHLGIIVDDKYDICQKIAAGGVGTVYRARHRYTGREVAIKLLNEPHCRDRGMCERFLREAKAAAEIGHPNIVDVVDAGVDEDVGVYVAFELLEGFDLAEALKRGSLSTDQVLQVADAALDALEAAHRVGIVHRDIKPPNIFLIPGEQGALHVRVLDFGAAKRQHVATEETLTTVGTVIGTPAYMSPEQASGEPVDGRTDVWAMGALLFRALAGRMPFAEKNPNRLIASIIRDDAPSLGEFRPDLSAGVVQVVDKALVRDPELRWQSASAMQAALRHAAEQVSAPVVRPALPTLPETPASLRREALSDAPDDTIEEESPLVSTAPSRRAWAPIVGGLLVVAVVGGAFAWWRSSSPPNRGAAPIEPAHAALVASAVASAPDTDAAWADAAENAVSGPDGGMVPGRPSAAARSSSRSVKTPPTSTQRPPVAPIREYE